MTTPKANPDRRQRKAALEARIDQQRHELGQAVADWQRSSRSLEAGWDLIQRYRTPLLVGGGLLALPLLRRSERVWKLGQRLLIGALTVNRLRYLLPLKRH